MDENGNIEFDLDLSGLKDEILDACDFGDKDESFLVHIHGMWDSDEIEEFATAADCAPKTGGAALVYDPFLTNTMCAPFVVNNAMLTNAEPGGPALDDSKEPSYFNCRIGDISGRFGPTDEYLTSDNRFVLTENISYESSSGKDDGFCGLRLTPEQLGMLQRSIVFHCNDDGKAIVFCAPFETVVYDEGNY